MHVFVEADTVCLKCGHFIFYKFELSKTDQKRNREKFYRKGQILKISKGFYTETRRHLEKKKSRARYQK